MFIMFDGISGTHMNTSEDRAMDKIIDPQIWRQRAILC